jgi:antitoxin PrlF
MHGAPWHRSDATVRWYQDSIGTRARAPIVARRSCGRRIELNITEGTSNVTVMTTRATLGNRHRARLTSQGQITVPKAIRDALGARPGDDLEFVPRGRELIVEVRPRHSVLDFAGLASDAAARIPATAAELDDLIARGMAGDAVARATSGRRKTGRSR